jgi:hypothetical protein
VKLPRYHSLASIFFLAISAARGQQLAPDCTSPENLTDPRCEALQRSLNQVNLETLSTPRIPVIRDQSPRDQVSQHIPSELSASQGYPVPGTVLARPPLPPEAPTEFQLFVKQSIGRLLPLFGQLRSRRRTVCP